MVMASQTMIVRSCGVQDRGQYLVPYPPLLGPILSPIQHCWHTTGSNFTVRDRYQLSEDDEVYQEHEPA